MKDGWIIITVKNKIKENLIKNQKIIQKAIDLDNSKWQNNFKFESLIIMLEKFDEKDLKSNTSLKSGETYIVLYSGDPNLTLGLTLISMGTNSNLIFILYDDMLAVNRVLIKIIQKTAESNNLKNFVKLYNNPQNCDIEKSTLLADKIIFIGDGFDYADVKRKFKIPIIHVI
jgi:hypothetical protein